MWFVSFLEMFWQTRAQQPGVISSHGLVCLNSLPSCHKTGKRLQICELRWSLSFCIVWQSGRRRQKVGVRSQRREFVPGFDSAPQIQTICWPKEMSASIFVTVRRSGYCVKLIRLLECHVSTGIKTMVFSPACANGYPKVRLQLSRAFMGP